ncbi:hypothetical protein BTA51_28745 [Hahella sp. CCB-MM4]|uniref:hypothetical protein n=1 Tax=Hahella sp. (strain CCB-MM4) TaxID=1926491 RepID=UPI000B9B7EE4|nr:hypothetical protein [Hahella sp. CCB-MM4]OZG69912.1 hypothetical protein BTA51_28745 [Hahella sp. CCB-MM4]
MFQIIWVTSIIFVCMGFYFHGRFLDRIKDQYPDLYVSLGEPRMFTRYPIAKHAIIKDLSPEGSFTGYTEFMSERKWVGLGDKELSKYASYRRYTQYSLVVLFLLALLSSGVQP